MSKKTEAQQPMDPSIREDVVGTPAVNNQRVCWAAQTLVAEVEDLFPLTPVEYSAHDGRNTALAVTFDLTVHDPVDASTLITLLDLSDSDHRIAEVLMEDQHVLVTFKANPRTQDSRDPFGLADALDVLAEAEGAEAL